MTQPATRICILGGGFGGLYTALRLSQLPWRPQEGNVPPIGQKLPPDIVLVDQHDRFVFSPLLYELVTGELQSWEIAPPYSELLANTTVQFCQGVVTGINLQTQEISLQTGSALTYDYLVLSMGGETPLDIVPGATEHAIPFRRLADAFRLQEKLKRLEASELDKIRVAIVGAGYSGVELACKLADRLQDRGRIRLIERGNQILRSSPGFNREAAQKALSARKIWIDLETTVESITADSLLLNYKGRADTIPAELVLWTVGNKMHPVIHELPFKKNQRGQLMTTPTLQVMEHPHIFALGDLADCRDITGQQVPATAQAAFQQADYLGWNLWATLTERPLLPWRYQHLGEMITLGADNATLAGLGVQLDGGFAHLARRLFYLMRMPTWEHQLKVGLNWIARPYVDLLGELTSN
jgi:NADH dehydrogenase